MLTFVYKKFLQKKNLDEILKEHNAAKYKYPFTLKIVKCFDRILTYPFSFIAAMLGYNGIINMILKISESKKLQI